MIKENIKENNLKMKELLNVREDIECCLRPKTNKDFLENDKFLFNRLTQEIVGYTGNNDIVKIPSEIRGVKVISIGYRAFENKKISKLIVSEGIKIIRESAFRNCNIKNIDLPESISIIEDRSFYNNKLRNISLPVNSYLKIGEEAFKNNNIKEVKILDHCKIYDNSFDEGVVDSKNIKYIKKKIPNDYKNFNYIGVSININGETETKVI